MSAAAKRYAEALLDSVMASGAEGAPRAAEELATLARAIDEAPDLRNALENPSYSLPERLKVLDAVSASLGLSKRTRTLARLAVERGRAADLGAIAEAFRKMLDERTGMVRALVTTARPLDDATWADIKAALEKRTGKTVELETQIDPELIGGVRAQVGSFVFDGSIRAELERLRERLADD